MNKTTVPEGGSSKNASWNLGRCSQLRPRIAASRGFYLNWPSRSTALISAFFKVTSHITYKVLELLYQPSGEKFLQIYSELLVYVEAEQLVTYTVSTLADIRLE